MFNLETAITEWRSQMSGCRLAPDTLDELESHLRDELEQQLKFGLEAQPAFAAAVRKIGQPGALEAEFMKSRTMKGYRLSAIINSSLGAFFLLLAGVSVLIQERFPALGTSLAWGFIPGAVFHMTLGLFHREKFLRLAQ